MFYLTLFQCLLASNGDVNVYTVARNSSCGNCTIFVCEGNETNILNINQNGHMCVTFQRNGQAVHNDCDNLHLNATAIVPDNDTQYLTMFTVVGEQCLRGGVESTSISCSDAQLNSKELIINAKPECESNNDSTCPQISCSGCISSATDINNWSYWCPELENFTESMVNIENTDIENIYVRSCNSCEFPINQSIVLNGLNGCGEYISINITMAITCGDTNGNLELPSPANNATAGTTTNVWMGLVLVVSLLLL